MCADINLSTSSVLMCIMLSLAPWCRSTNDYKRPFSFYAWELLGLFPHITVVCCSFQALMQSRSQSKVLFCIGKLVITEFTDSSSLKHSCLCTMILVNPLHHCWSFFFWLDGKNTLQSEPHGFRLGSDQLSAESVLSQSEPPATLKPTAFVLLATILTIVFIWNRKQSSLSEIENWRHTEFVKIYFQVYLKLLSQHDATGKDPNIPHWI